MVLDIENFAFWGCSVKCTLALLVFVLACSSEAYELSPN